MNRLDALRSVIAEAHSIRLIEEGIYSVLPDIPHTHQYDSYAGIYDFLVKSRLYNQLIWGDSPQSYMAFAQDAVDSTPDGWILDAGCGSLLFSAPAHRECRRPVLACDQSLDMLRRARQRLMAIDGSVPERIFLLQADLSDLPFRAASFHTILCLNVLHHYATVPDLVSGFRALLANGGQIYLTSLVMSNRFIGDHYLGLLHRRGWIVKPRKDTELRDLLRESLGVRMTYRTQGNMAYARTAGVA